MKKWIIVMAVLGLLVGGAVMAVAQPAEDLRLAKQLAGTWKSMFWDQPDNAFAQFMKFEGLGGIHVQITWWLSDLDSPTGRTPTSTYKAYIKKGSLVRQGRDNPRKIILSPDGMSWYFEDEIRNDGLPMFYKKIE